MPPVPHSFRIHRIRLINFHNFTKETITVENGGHLFLLGDNGSGKTTVLDAVHYVLTAGQSMEFNSAARVAGNRKDSGRREQGIVMRYNINAEPATMNPAGGITYAAVELRDNRNNPLVLAIGLSCASMDEAIQRWGIVRSGPLEEIPFLVEELNGERPLNRREMKSALDGKGFYGQIGSYRRELAARIYGDEPSYAEVCKFLATGKAYREIVSRTADYHQLFRELLQEPDADVFQKVIEHLRALDNSRQDLDRMHGRLVFLSGLTTLRNHVEDRRKRMAALRWLGHDLKQKHHLEEHARIAETTGAEKNRLEQLLALNQKTKLELDELGDRIHEFDNKDKNGLVAHQRRLENELKTAALNLGQAQSDWENLSQQHQQREKNLDKLRQQLLKNIRRRFTAIHRAAGGLPVSVQPVLNQLDAAASAERPEQRLSELDSRNEQSAAHEQLMQAQAEKQTCRQECDALAESIRELEEKLEAKRKQGEAEPLIDGFADARKQIAENLFAARPLYAGLEPRNGISRKELSTLEQLIGEEILGTWLVPAEEEGAVRQLLFTRFPAQTLAVVEPDATDPIADWIRHHFDPETSDPFALIALHREMASASAPSTRKFSDFESLLFRARQRKLHGAPVRLLGADTRRRQLEQEIRELENETKSLSSRKNKADAALRETEERIEALNRLKSELDLQELRREAAEADAAFHDTEHLRIRTDNAFEQLNRAEENHAIANEKLAEVRLQIESEGLHDLEERIASLKKQRDRKQKQFETDTKESGKLESEIDRAVAFAATLVKAMQQELAIRAEAEQALRSFGDFEDAAPFVAEIIGPTGHVAAEQAETELRDLELETAEKETELKGLAASQEGQSFAFVYSREPNSLTDRRGMSADQVFEELSRTFREQQEIITEETRRLFEQFIMQDLLTALRDRVSRLEHMSRRIGKILKDREFGNNRYSFSAKPLDPYKRLYNLIRSYSELAAEDPARELKEFIEEHQEAILNTAPGDMPELLDYRNWFHFDLQVRTGTHETTMTRKTKSIGSGGEQAVPNYLIVLTIAHFLYDVPAIKLPLLLFDEAFYGIDSQRRDQLLAFASELDLQLFVASPDQDGVKKEIPFSTSLFVIKDKECNVHLHDFHWANPKAGIQQDLLNREATAQRKIGFGEELEA